MSATRMVVTICLCLRSRHKLPRNARDVKQGHTYCAMGATEAHGWRHGRHGGTEARRHTDCAMDGTEAGESGATIRVSVPEIRVPDLHRIGDHHIVVAALRTVNGDQSPEGRRPSTMTIDQAELRREFTSASLGHTAYLTWALKARHERRLNIARLFEALGAAKMARAENAFRQLGE